MNNELNPINNLKRHKNPSEYRTKESVSTNFNSNNDNEK